MSSTNPESYSAVDGCWNFDLQTYRDLGLDLSNLENSDPDAAMPSLRTAAKQYQTAIDEGGCVDRFAPGLFKEHGRVDKELESARARLNRILGTHTITDTHPAIQEYLQRHPEATEAAPNTAIPRIKLMLSRIDWINVVLVRPVDPENEPGFAEKGIEFKPITLPNANYYISPTQVASQLAHARVGTHFDI